MHEATADVEVIFTDLTQLGEWVGEAATTDDVTLGGIEWRLTDATRRRVQEAAQRGAVADALAKAQVYASALGLGAPTAVELADHGMLSAQPIAAAPRMMAMRASADVGRGAGSTEFAPAELVIEASVDARFTAEPT